jgi:hypothetical protein
MFYKEVKLRSNYLLKIAEAANKKLVKEVQVKSEKLFNIRNNSEVDIIFPVKEYIDSLLNNPKSLDKSFSEYKSEFNVFSNFIRELSDTSVAKTKLNVPANGWVTGVVAGIGVSAMMPPTVIAIATTFGTAGTGAAISSLSGAAATNAAIAWLGGGAIAAGGAGMVGGTALLALSAPISIGVGAAFFHLSRNKDTAKKNNIKRRNIERTNKFLEGSKSDIDKIISLTLTHQEGVLDLIFDLKRNAPKDYNDFQDKDKAKLGLLLNHISHLSQLINKKVG